MMEGKGKRYLMSFRHSIHFVVKVEMDINRLDLNPAEVNEKAYNPDIVAIGPYHRGEDCLQMMEEHKLRYLQLLLERKNEADPERYVFAIRSLEQEARRCYAEPISLNPDEMIEI
ncbi:hypothetical protein ACSBR2_030520 [Camellia fascicularis]